MNSLFNSSIFEPTAKEKMDKVMNIDHIREQIFGDFDDETLEICRQVCEDWKFWVEELQRKLIVKYMLDFGDKEHDNEDEDLVPSNVVPDIEEMEWGTVKDVIPGWCEAVKKLVEKSNLEDLKEVKDSLKKIEQELGLWRFLGDPLHLAAEFGHVQLMQLLLYTKKDVNDAVLFFPYEDGNVHSLYMCRAYASNGYTAFMAACYHGQLESVKFMIKSSKQFGIDLNAITPDDGEGKTGFLFACEKGHTEVVKVILESSKEYDIDINETDVCGSTGFELAWMYGQIEVVKLLFENHLKYDIPFQDWWFPSIQWEINIFTDETEMRKLKAIIKEAQKKKHREMKEKDANRLKKAQIQLFKVQIPWITDETKIEMKEKAQRKKQQKMEETDANRSKKARYNLRSK